MLVEVVVPYRGGCPHRARALKWVLGRHVLPVTVAEAPDGPWSKARAVMPAVAASTADIVVMADADVWTEGLPEAIRAVEGGAPWCIPHQAVHRLDETGTAAVLRGESWEDQPVTQVPYWGIPGGGFMVARRAVMLSVPLDPRYVGWGQEDESWAMALQTMCGDGWRGTAPLIHLWHPAQPRLTRKRGSVENWELRRRYLRARGNPAAMGSLIQEAHEYLDSHQPGMRSPATVAAGVG